MYKPSSIKVRFLSISFVMSFIAFCMAAFVHSQSVLDISSLVTLYSLAALPLIALLAWYHRIENNCFKPVLHLIEQLSQSLGISDDLVSEISSDNLCRCLTTVDEAIHSIQSKHDTLGLDIRSSIKEVNDLTKEIGLEMEDQQ